MIKKIKLKTNESYKDYLDNNVEEAWEMIVNAIEILSISPHLNKCVAFILYKEIDENGSSEEKVIIQRKNILDTIEKGLSSMEEYENYEMCDRLVKVRKSFENNK